MPTMRSRSRHSAFGTGDRGELDPHGGISSLSEMWPSPSRPKRPASSSQMAGVVWPCTIGRKRAHCSRDDACCSPHANTRVATFAGCAGRAVPAEHLDHPADIGVEVGPARRRREQPLVHDARAALGGRRGLHRQRHHHLLLVLEVMQVFGLPGGPVAAQRSEVAVGERGIDGAQPAAGRRRARPAARPQRSRRRSTSSSSSNIASSSIAMCTASAAWKRCHSAANAARSPASSACSCRRMLARSASCALRMIAKGIGFGASAAGLERSCRSPRGCQ